MSLIFPIGLFDERSENPVKSSMGANGALVSPSDFKSGVPCQKRGRWVRFPLAPANPCKTPCQSTDELLAAFLISRSIFRTKSFPSLFEKRI